jgi:hypothetical protein
MKTNKNFPGKMLTSKIILILMIANLAQSQWILSGGPEGGEVKCLATSTSGIYAGTYGGGIFYSSNNGSNWKTLNTDLRNDSINALYTAPQN